MPATTSVSTMCTDRPRGPLMAPLPSHRLADAPLRSPVVLRGVVVDVRVTQWVGGPVLEAILSDGTDGVCLAFLGRRRIPGVDAGRTLTVAGSLGSRHGRSVLMNPQYWLHRPDSEATDA